MIMIRLSRVGKKKKPLYRIVAQDKHTDPWGKTLEILGTYNPHTKALEVKKERVEHWISVGAQMSPSINNLLVENKVVEGKKVKAAKLNKKKEEKKEDGDKKEDKPKESGDEKPAETEKKVEEVKEKKEEAKPEEENKEEAK